MSWDSFEKKTQRGPVSAILAITFVGVFGLFVLVSTGFIANPFIQVMRVVNKTIDADNVIYNYEWFKSRHEAIKALDRKIVDAKTAVDEHSSIPNILAVRDGREELSRLRSIAQGLEYQRADLVGEYNAKSRMVNRSIFKAGDVELPERIEL